MRSVTTLAAVAAVALVSGCGGGSDGGDSEPQLLAAEDLRAIVAPDPALEAPGIVTGVSRTTATSVRSYRAEAGGEAFAVELVRTGFRDGARTVWSGQQVARADALLFGAPSRAQTALAAAQTYARETLGGGAAIDELSVQGLGEGAWGLTAQLESARDAGAALAIYGWRRANVVLTAQIDCGLGRECPIDVARATRAYARAVDAAAREALAGD